MEEPELLEIHIKGPGPYGFRLYGGQGDPLIVAKLRARSKAHDAGLREGDVVLGINGRSCQSMSHGIAMALLESANDALHLHLYRGSTAKASLSAAYQSLVPQLRPVSPDTVPPNRSIFTIQPTSEAQPPADPQPSALQPPVQPHADEQVAAPATSISRQQEVTSFGAGVMQTITTEKEKQDVGGATLTKVTRQVVLETSGGGDTWPSSQEPAKRDDDVDVQRAAIFHVPKIKAQPLLWQPESSGSGLASERGREAAGRILVNRPVTVDVSSIDSAGGNENDAPRVRTYASVEPPPPPPREEPPRFKVPQRTAKPWVWQPSFVSSVPVREASPAMAFHALDGTGPPPASAASVQEHQLDTKKEQSRRGGGEEFGRGEGGEGGEEDLSDSLVLSPDLIRVLTTEGPEEDWATTIKRKKKIFADSSFYDDSQHRYPTIEEQIKMARKVALSLSAPDNVTARGQRMFMKLKQKAKEWTTDDMSFEGLAALSTRPFGLRLQRPSTEVQDLYYNAVPWKTPTARRVEKVSLDQRVRNLEGHPEEAQESFAKSRAPFKRGLDYPSSHLAHYDRGGRKVHPSGSGHPQPFHGMANVLGEMRGKGAQLFAKRRAKLADEEEEEEGRLNGWRSEGEAGQLRERSEERASSDYPDPSGHPQRASARRLEELISISKAYLSPWESTAGRRQAGQEPWRQKTEGEPWKGAATEHFRSTRATSEQRTAEDGRPSFLGKQSSGVYRPVKFHLPAQFQPHSRDISQF